MNTISKPRPVTPDDLLRYQIAHTPVISPDGRQIIFVKKDVDTEKNRYVQSLWIVDAAGGTPRQFTSGDRDHSPTWSHDGQMIAFTRSNKDDQSQICLLNTGGGEARPLTSFPEGSIGGFRWSPDGSKIAVTFRDQIPEQTKEAKRQRKETHASDPPFVTERRWYRLDGDGYFGDQRYKLFLVDVSTGEATLVCDEDVSGSYSFDFSPDSSRLAVTVNRHPDGILESWHVEILVFDTQTGEGNPLPDITPGVKDKICWSPDGQWLAYAGRTSRDDIYSPENLGLFICPATGGASKNLLEGTDHCMLATSINDMGEAGFSPSLTFDHDSSRVYCVLGWEGTRHIASVPVTGGPVQLHTEGICEYDTGNISADGSTMALSVITPTHPPEIAVARTAPQAFDVKTLTDFNGPVVSELKLAEPQSHWVTAEDGQRVQVWVLLPPDYTEGQAEKLPAVLEIHGGPHAMYGSGMMHEFQTLASAGYAVFYSNPRGSKGYGEQHCSAIRGSWGDRDWVDIQAVTAFIKSRPFVDPQRMAIMGGSYGGYMTNWAIGHTRDFTAAVSDRSLCNMVSFQGNADFMSIPGEYFPGNFWSAPEALWECSPLRSLGEARTPTLFIHSEGDLRCNIEQAEQAYVVLQLHKVPVRMVRYPVNTSHGMSRIGPPDLRVHRLGEILAWYSKHL